MNFSATFVKPFYATSNLLNTVP